VKSMKTLIADHQIILRALLILDEMVSETERGKEINKANIRTLLSFFRDFADGCHHVREEAILFPALMQAGMAFQDGALPVMGAEHERGRALTSTMSRSLDENKIDVFLTSAREYIRLVAAHIDKESSSMFDLAQQALSDEDDDKIADDFEQFEKTTTGMQARERAHKVIERLALKHLQTVA
jgi:hemerythrin-like domain-containing protein